jgi:hypothetical protein
VGHLSPLTSACTNTDTHKDIFDSWAVFTFPQGSHVVRTLEITALSRQRSKVYHVPKNKIKNNMFGFRGKKSKFCPFPLLRRQLVFSYARRTDSRPKKPLRALLRSTRKTAPRMKPTMPLRTRTQSSTTSSTSRVPLIPPSGTW